MSLDRAWQDTSTVKEDAVNAKREDDRTYGGERSRVQEAHSCRVKRRKRVRGGGCDGRMHGRKRQEEGTDRDRAQTIKQGGQRERVCVSVMFTFTFWSAGVRA